MKQIIFSVVAAMAMGVSAETVNTVKVTKFHQSYPYSGKATVEYTVGGTLPADAFVEFAISTDDASATFTNTTVVTGSNSYTIDFASFFGGAQVLTNASFVVTILGSGNSGGESSLGGVQLWENGTYWAECNVGATKPEDYGYYFWWGDTVGYKRENDAWVASDGSVSNFLFITSNAQTFEKDNSALRSTGYIDSTGNLVAAHDAATAHLGLPWRMPTDAEWSALINNCTTRWITTNGVNGSLVTGKDEYADRSIFLPAAGYCYDALLYFPGSSGYYWSSTPGSGNSYYASYLRFYSGYFDRSSNDRRYNGQAVRPVRGFAE